MLGWALAGWGCRVMPRIDSCESRMLKDPSSQNLFITTPWSVVA